MATWTAPLPPDDTAAGDPGHPGMHNELVVALEEVRTNVDASEALPTAATITGATTVGRALLVATDAAAARTALGATAVGSSLMTAANAGAALTAVGGASGTAGAIGAVTGRALVGGTLLTASASDHTHTGLMTGTVAAVNNSAVPFADLTAAATAYNTLLAALRLRGVISGS